MKFYKLIYLLIIAAIISCDNENEQEEISFVLQNEYFTVEEGLLVYGQMPASNDTTDLIDVKLSGLENILEGDETEFNVNVSTNPVTIYFSVPDVNSYYVVNIPEAAQSNKEMTYTLNFPDQVSKDYFYIHTAYMDTSGLISARDSVKIIQANGVLSTMQVELSWDNTNDLDLLLIEPNKDTVYYYNKRSSNGGELIKDSYPFCWEVGDSTELIRYTEEAFLEAGKYEVLVGMHSSCEEKDTYFNVTVKLDSVVYDIEGIANPYNDSIASGVDYMPPTKFMEFELGKDQKSYKTKKVIYFGDNLKVKSSDIKKKKY